MPVRTSDLTYQQTAALGFAAKKPWGAPPKRPATWASLVRHGLIADLHTMALSDDGQRIVAELDQLNNRPQSAATEDGAR